MCVLGARRLHYSRALGVERFKVRPTDLPHLQPGRSAEVLAEGHKSMAHALVYRAPDRTLTAEEVETTHARLVRKVCSAVGGELRG